ncbi:ethanolamine ammonia-lyase subunit EutC [Sporomusa sp.]|uniref:ethanolamine ammonia-lyase subunit EutC n=1 Tax=Sporomusa sp. TaxID=2078658 RepID=UPI002CC2B1F5|nr:ethanolamine ammonia-lyase subunit EutC [Sporomusa sp.]HWR44125.1 ethanolamine ammonia-lyase subunit EutC [Sporomusa sp.]
MVVENNIRLIVEQVLAEMNKTAKGAVECSVTQRQPVTSGEQAEYTDDYLDDLAEIDLQKYLQVPEPVNSELYKDMKLATPARIGVWRTGVRPLTDTLLRFRADHAMAQDSVLGEVPEKFAAQYNMVPVVTKCSSKDEYLTRPDLGRLLDAENIEILRQRCEKGVRVQVVVADGLSSKAVEANIPNLLPAMIQGLSSMGIAVGTTIFVKYARVGIMDVIGEELKPEVVIVLLGERPGLGTAESMSAYIGYNARRGMIESERTVVSNIHKGGLPSAEAGAHLADLLKRILDAKATGVNLK